MIKVNNLIARSLNILAFFCTELEQKPDLHLVRIRFGTFRFVRITKDVKANWIVKISHFGGIAGLFNGFAIIAIFEFLPLVTAAITYLCKDGKNNKKEPKKKPNFNDKMDLDQTKNCEALEKEVDAILSELEKRLDIVDYPVIEDMINEKMDDKTHK